ncbi:MAG: DNA-binding protein WhiA [Clostridium sp.]|nr:MAG: DNA-binding protein WhiA [Clostridium sp.]
MLFLYIKDVNLICDFFKNYWSNRKCFFQIEDAVIKREIHQTVSRNLNCELANETKTFQAAKEQMAYIQYLEYNYPLDKLDPKLLLIMKVRKEHMEASFNELLEILEKNEYGEEMTKSGLNHRFS